MQDAGFAIKFSMRIQMLVFPDTNYKKITD
jgi:hypothetical protein